MTRLFIYGSLLSHSRHEMADWLRQHGAWIGPASMPGRLFHVSWYPGALYEPESPYRVWGELLSLDKPEGVWPVLDDFEGYESHNLVDSLYLRRQVAVECLGASLNAWTYIYNQRVDPRQWVPSGRWEDAHLKGGAT